MTTNDKGGCGSAPKLIFPCSGAADVGAVADQAARTLAREGAGKMSCLAGIGGRIPVMMTGAAAASRILAIDGCPHGCAKNTLLQAGFKTFEHLLLSDLDMKKGETPPTPEHIGKAVTAGKALLGA